MKWINTKLASQAHTQQDQIDKAKAKVMEIMPLVAKTLHPGDDACADIDAQQWTKMVEMFVDTAYKTGRKKIFEELSNDINDKAQALYAKIDPAFAQVGGTNKKIKLIASNLMLLDSAFAHLIDAKSKASTHSIMHRHQTEIAWQFLGIFCLVGSAIPAVAHAFLVFMVIFTIVDTCPKLMEFARHIFQHGIKGRKIEMLKMSAAILIAGTGLTVAILPLATHAILFEEIALMGGGVVFAIALTVAMITFCIYLQKRSQTLQEIDMHLASIAEETQELSSILTVAEPESLQMLHLHPTHQAASKEALTPEQDAAAATQSTMAAGANATALAVDPPTTTATAAPQVGHALIEKSEITPEAAKVTIAKKPDSNKIQDEDEDGDEGEGEAEGGTSPSV